MAAPFCFDGLVQEWDAVEGIRVRVRNGGFVEEDCIGRTPCNKSAVLNADMLVPLLVRLAACGLTLPPVEKLREAASTFYSMHQREVDDARVDDTAWFCRHLVVFVKRKTVKRLVGIDARFDC